MNRNVVVVSVDGLSSVDLPRLEVLPNFRELLELGSLCREMRGTYPTQTYPLHASLITVSAPILFFSRAELPRTGTGFADFYGFPRCTTSRERRD